PPHPAPHPFPTRRSSDLLLVVEPGHRTGVETDGASGKDEIGALQGAVPERRRLDQRLVRHEPRPGVDVREEPRELVAEPEVVGEDRKSTRLNSSHRTISY